MLVRRIQAVNNNVNYFKNYSKPANYNFATRPYACDTVSFKGFYPERSWVTKTNYRAYDSRVGHMVDLEIRPSVDFKYYGGDDKFFPGIIAIKADGSSGNFDNVYMKNSNLEGSDFTRASFCNTKAHNSNLSICNFTEMTARRAKFAHSDFEDSVCRYANFEYSNLQGAKFNRADMFKANLNLSNVIGTDFSHARNLPEVMAGAVYNKDTKFPAGFSPIQAYMLEFKAGGDLEGSYIPSMYLKSSNELVFDDYSNMNLQRTILDKSRFEQLDMQNSNFDKGNMEKVVFDFCILNNSSFRNANLNRACFKNSDLQGATFEGDGTDLQFANFIGANLSGTDIQKLSKGQLRNALFSPATTLPEGMTVEDAKNLGMLYVVDTVDFSDKNLFGTNFKDFKFSQYGINSFSGARFERANLHSAKFDGANLINCVFDKASLKYSSLKDADCGGASFAGANMLHANLEGTNFKAANLCGANLTDAKINEETNFEYASYDENTVFPSGFSPNEHRMILNPNKKGALK